ncbi:MAG: F0F1 ATP synthase subunit B [Patescibacteria group bacterium]|nr:F0F1 ATP synthase subunit B [Patescibacteria group bacterium]
MLIDWFTVGAQVLNFLILVWLLKRFLYKPILNALDAREERIAAELADAATKQSQAERERDEFQKKNEEFDRQRDELLRRARDEAAEERNRLLDEARQAAEELRRKQQDALTREQDNLHGQIASRIRGEVFAIARKTLTDLAGASLEERMSEVFTRRLGELDDEARDGIAKALASQSEPLLVRSAFELPAKRQAAIRDALRDAFSRGIEVRFETAPDVISGIELIASGHKVSWSIADYLASLEESIGDLVKEPSRSQAADGAATRPKAKSQSESESESAAGEEAP